MVDKNALADEWKSSFAGYLAGRGSRIHFIGTGNSLRGDDAVGLYIARELRSRHGKKMPANVSVYPVSLNPELEMSRLDLTDSKLVIFDAVECDSPPGNIICAMLEDTKYGFFATHNIPLRLIPSLSVNSGSVMIVGIQPLSTEIGSGITQVVRKSAAEVIRSAAEILGAG